jgi:hypothetical protein
MFDSYWDAGQPVFLAVVLVAVAAIAFLLFRAFRRKNVRPWPAFFVGIYNIVLLLLFLFGMLTQVTWEGFSFFPLMALTAPWSWLLIWLSVRAGLLDTGIVGTGLAGSFLWIFISCNILAASANSGILYFLLKRRQRKLAEDEAWEQARRNR